jgi:hypothetical protein
MAAIRLRRAIHASIPMAASKTVIQSTGYRNRGTARKKA